MATIDVKLEWSGIAKKFKDPRFASQLLSEKYVREAQIRITEAIRAEAPVGKHFDIHGNPIAGGELKNSINSNVYHEEGKSQIAVKTRSSHAVFVIGGTQPHNISSEGHLVFWWEKMNANFPYGAYAGQGAFAGNPYAGLGQSVNHPGQQPNEFVTRAWHRISTSEREFFIKSVRAQLK